MARFAISVFGRDRPGIVAAVTRALADAGCNLEDTSMTILRGHFAMMLVVAGGAAAGPQALDARLAPVAERLDLQVSTRPLDDRVTGLAEGGERWPAAARPSRPTCRRSATSWASRCACGPTRPTCCSGRPAGPATAAPVAERR